MFLRDHGDAIRFVLASNCLCYSFTVLIQYFSSFLFLEMVHSVLRAALRASTAVRLNWWGLTGGSMKIWRIIHYFWFMFCHDPMNFSWCVYLYLGEANSWYLISSGFMSIIYGSANRIFQKKLNIYEENFAKFNHHLYMA